MKVSIVTISYNQAQFLERTIRSVLAQTYPDVEYIVVDPGSTDGSRDIIERYRSEISTVLFEPDFGAADGLNKGFALASGEVLGFVNSDDTLLPQATEEVVRFFRRHPTVDVVSGHCMVVDEDDRPLRKSYSDRFSVIKYAYGAVVLMQPSTFIRSTAFKKVGGFNIENRSSWDGELFVELGRAGARFARLDRVLSCYRLHATSITSSGSRRRQQDEDHMRMFMRIMGRPWRVADWLPALVFRLYKHFSNPRALHERLSKGPVYGRHVTQRTSQREDL